VALPKSGKNLSNPKSYKPISLLCHTYKLYEKMIVICIKTQIDQQIIPEQIGFRPGKTCVSQILDLCQHIEDDFENKTITGVVFVDFTAAYDTVNHNILLQKIYYHTKNWEFVQLVASLLYNRRFMVTLNNK